MLFVDNASRAVSVEKVNCQEKSFRQQLKRGMSFYQEIDEVWTHEPLYFCLYVDRSNIRQCFGLSTCVSIKYKRNLNCKALDLHDLHVPQMVIPIFEAC